MTDTRQSFFTAIAPDLPAPDGSAEGPAADWITALADYSLLGVSGVDAQRFLQGQLSCDVRPVSAQRATPGAYCNPKGRVLASFVLAATTEGDYRLRLRRDIAADTAATLGRYIVFSKARVEDLGDAWVLLGLHGTAAANTAAEWLGGAPDGQWQVYAGERGQLLQLDEAGGRHELWLPASLALSAWKHLRTVLPVAAARAWQRLNVEQGIAEIHAGNREQLLPEMLNYPETGAVSFRKGCYTGQEVIARMHYRGNRKRALYRCGYTGQDPAAGDAVLSSADHSSAGEVFEAIDGELLAILNTSIAPDAPLLLAGDPERPLTRMALPYAIDTRSAKP